MSTLRLAPRLEERATWCRHCDTLVHAGLTPIRDVASCPRCLPTASDWLKHLGFTLIMLALFLVLLIVGTGEPPNDSVYPRPAMEEK